MSFEIFIFFSSTCSLVWSKMNGNRIIFYFSVRTQYNRYYRSNAYAKVRKKGNSDCVFHASVIVLIFIYSNVNRLMSSVWILLIYVFLLYPLWTVIHFTLHVYVLWMLHIQLKKKNKHRYKKTLLPTCVIVNVQLILFIGMYRA